MKITEQKIWLKIGVTANLSKLLFRKMKNEMIIHRYLITEIMHLAGLKKKLKSTK